jgi:hypothetical protein
VQRAYAGKLEAVVLDSPGHGCGAAARALLAGGARHEGNSGTATAPTCEVVQTLREALPVARMQAELEYLQRENAAMFERLHAKVIVEVKRAKLFGLGDCRQVGFKGW